MHLVQGGVQGMHLAVNTVNMLDAPLDAGLDAVFAQGVIKGFDDRIDVFSVIGAVALNPFRNVVVGIGLHVTKA